MIASSAYNKNFYKEHHEGSRRSAAVIVPIVLELVGPQSVIDVGCGAGTWLSVFNTYGIEDFYGVDGDWVERHTLEIPVARFLSCDLQKPLRIDKQFDLVVSLEVAEHLPADCAENFVDSLTRLGPVIVFSAAIPCQEGTNHVNEQWPDDWVNLFKEKQYIVIDCVRNKIWQNDVVDWWYAQNILLFVKSDYLENYPLLKKEAEITATRQLSIVHPKPYLELHRLFKTVNEIGEIISPRETFILVDHDMLRSKFANGRWAIPFLEREGQYWGPPPDDKIAIREFTRLRMSGAKFIMFAWYAFWWLDHYREFHHMLRSHYRCALENERLIVFELGSS